MARKTADVCITLQHATLDAVDAAAQDQCRSRSQMIDLILKKALAITATDRARDPKAIADAATTPKGPK